MKYLFGFILAAAATIIFAIALNLTSGWLMWGPLALSVILLYPAVSILGGDFLTTTIVIRKVENKQEK